jgi:hypothetical protein
MAIEKLAIVPDAVEGVVKPSEVKLVPAGIPNAVNSEALTSICTFICEPDPAPAR